LDGSRRGILERHQESRGAPRDSPSIRIHIRHICVLPFHIRVPAFNIRIPASRIESMFPVSPRRPVLLPSPLYSWVRYQPRIVLPVSIHSARPLFSERKQHLRCLRHMAGRHVSSSEEEEQEGGRTSEINRFLEKAPCRWAKHPWITERRARIHPPIPAFPLWGRGQRSGRLPATGAVQYPDCCPTVHHSFWSEAKLSRPLARTAEWIVFRGNARPVVAVANCIGHTRRPVLRKVSSSGTRPEKAAQGGVLPLLCGSINVPYECNPVGRSGRDVPFLTGQKGDGKSRTNRH
jgi:hypothetical protein